MGLDTYAVRPEKDADGLYLGADAQDFADVGPLVGGLFSGNGNNGSFRGKVYSDPIEEVTAVSLYQEYIEPSVVAEMSQALDAATDYDGEDLDALRQFFRVCRNKGYGLSGWW